MTERVNPCHNNRIYSVTQSELESAFPNSQRIYSDQYVTLPREGTSYWQQSIDPHFTVYFREDCPNVTPHGECQLGDARPKSCKTGNSFVGLQEIK